MQAWRWTDRRCDGHPTRPTCRDNRSAAAPQAAGVPRATRSVHATTGSPHSLAQPHRPTSSPRPHARSREWNCPTRLPCPKKMPSPHPCVRGPLARRPALRSVRRLGTPLLPAAARVSTPPTWARATGRLPAPRAAPTGVREGVQERSHAASGSPAAGGAPALAPQGARAAHHITPEAGAAGAADAAGPTGAPGTLFGAIALITGSTVGAGEPVCSCWPSLSGRPPRCCRLVLSPLWSLVQTLPAGR